MMSTPINVGIMGCGEVASYGHAPSIVATEGLKLQAVYDPNPERLRLFQERFGVEQTFTDAEAFMRSGIQAVSVTSPAPFHKENILLAAANRLPVLCEKPLAMDVQEAGEMIEAMKRAGVSLHTAFCYRHSPVALKIRELVRAGAIGNVGALRLIYNWGLHGRFQTLSDGSRALNQRREGRMAEGGPMVDCGTHQIDLATFWLDSGVASYSGFGAWIDKYEAPEHIWLHMDHDCGAHTLVEISFAYHHTTKNPKSEFIYELIGSDGVIRYHREAKTFTMENGNGRQEIEFSSEKSFSGMYEAWSHHLHNPSDPSTLLADGEQGRRVIDIARTVTDNIMGKHQA